MIDLDDPIALMLVAAAALERSGGECAAYGGLVLGMYGEPRETRDADFAVMGVDLDRARLALADLGVEVVIAFSNVRSVLETQRTRLDESLIRTEIQQLVEEIPDHDIRGRFARLSAATC